MTARIGTVVALATVALAISACGTLNRTATLNQRTSGAGVALALQRQLARQGHPAARVTCAKTLVVNVGVTYACGLSGTSGLGAVRFTFSSTNGNINLSSVRVR